MISNCSEAPENRYAVVGDFWRIFPLPISILNSDLVLHCFPACGCKSFKLHFQNYLITSYEFLLSFLSMVMVRELKSKMPLTLNCINW